MKLWMLGSGSRGNALLIESGASRVLVDAGFTPRALAERLAAVHVAGESIEAVVVTHEHQDHVRGACAGAKRWGWTIHATAGTQAACPALRLAGARTFAAGAPLRVGAFELEPVGTPHDAAEPVALVVTDIATGVRAGIAYDLGHVSPAVRAALVELDLLVLEANHDEEMLRSGPYPRVVQDRIAGEHGHLSNRAAATLAAGCAHRALEHIVLAHLSQVCNQPRLAADAVRTGVARTAFRGAIHAAPQDATLGPFAPGGGARQLSLGL